MNKNTYQIIARSASGVEIATEYILHNSIFEAVEQFKSHYEFTSGIRKLMLIQKLEVSLTSVNTPEHQ